MLSSQRICADVQKTEEASVRCLDGACPTCPGDGAATCLDGRVAGLSGDAAVVVTVAGHHDVTFQPPRGTPAVQHRMTIKRERQKG